MKVERRSGSDERVILTAIITDTSVCARVLSKWEKDKGLFASPWANMIGGWCQRYYDKYGEAPKANLHGMFERWAGKGERNPDTVTMIDRFLTGLSADHARGAINNNSNYVLDLATAHFNKVRLRRVAEMITASLDDDDVDAAQKAFEVHNPMDLAGSDGIDLLQNEAAVDQAFEEKKEPLIVFPGALGEFFMDSLERDGFVALTGPEKRGKTFWLMEIAYQAITQRRRTAFFQVGDMSESQMIRRFACRAAGVPLKPGKIQYPTKITKEEGSLRASAIYREKNYGEGLGKEAAKQAFRDLCNTKIKSNDSYIKLSTHPNTSINVSGIKAQIQRWEKTGWVPDVVIIDYADILAPPFGVAETRDQINMTWKQLRALSQVYHCLVVTATQSDTASYTANIIRKTNFTDDKRKHAHVTGMLGLNQSIEEKEEGIMRLNWIDLRENPFSETQCVHVAGCLPIACPAVRSCW